MAIRFDEQFIETHKRPADMGWHVITVQRDTARTLCIEKIVPITHWHGHHPVINGKPFPIYVDADEIRHIIYCNYIMDPLGRLLDQHKVIIANSVFDLQALVTAHYRRPEPELSDEWIDQDGNPV